MIPGARGFAFRGRVRLVGTGLTLSLAGIASRITQVSPIECAPRQKFARAHERPPDAPARPMGIVPLNVGFASGPHSSTSSQAPTTNPPSGSQLQMVAVGETRSEPLRADGTAVTAYARGSKRLAVAIAADDGARAEAAATLRSRVYAASNTGPTAAKLDTWSSIAAAAGYKDPFDITEAMIFEVVGALVKAGFRSVSSYAVLAKQEMLLRHGHVSPKIELLFKRARRAATRGLGPGRQASELPMLRLASLPDREEPLVTSGPCWAVRVSVLASWWMLREVEVANGVIEDATFDGDAASLRLAVSKRTKRRKGRSVPCDAPAAPERSHRAPGISWRRKLHSRARLQTVLANKRRLRRCFQVQDLRSSPRPRWPPRSQLWPLRSASISWTLARRRRDSPDTRSEPRAQCLWHRRASMFRGFSSTVGGDPRRC